jgi:hypothetical protein
MQRDSWQAALKFKTSAATIINDLGRQIQTLRGYEAFSYLDMDSIDTWRRAQAKWLATTIGSTLKV